MSRSIESRGPRPAAVAQLDEARRAFWRRACVCFAGVVVSFVVLAGLLVNVPGASSALAWAHGTHGAIPIAMGLVVALSLVAYRWMADANPAATRVAGLALLAVTLAVASVPVLALMATSDRPILSTAGVLAAATFAVFATLVYDGGEDLSRSIGGAERVATAGLFVAATIFWFYANVFWLVGVALDAKH